MDALFILSFVGLPNVSPTYRARRPSKFILRIINDETPSPDIIKICKNRGGWVSTVYTTHPPLFLYFLVGDDALASLFMICYWVLS